MDAAAELGRNPVSEHQIQPECGDASLFLRQKGAHLKNVWTIYNKQCMISHCSPFWRKNAGEYPSVSIQLNKCPFLAVEIAPFWRMHEIISERAVPPGSTTARLFCASAVKDSLKSQSGCDKLSERSASRLRKEILGTRDKEVATAYNIRCSRAC